VVHSREIIYRSAARLVEVTDHVHCASAHHVEILWHFAEQCLVTLGNDAARATREGVGIVLRWPAPLHAQLVRGSADPIQGWISHGFDQKVPADTLVVSGSVAGDWQGVSTIEISLPGSA
jgi:Heparinase II/III-like protein